MEGGRRSLSSRRVDCLLKSVVSRQTQRSIVTVVVSLLLSSVLESIQQR